MRTALSKISGAGGFVAILIAVAALVAWQWPDDDPQAAPPVRPAPSTLATVAVTTTTVAPTTTTTTGEPDDNVAPSALIATLTADIPRFPAPGAEPDGTVAATWHQRPSALAVINEQPGWLQVRLPQRPNGSTTWIRRDDVELSSTPSRIVVDVATMRLRLYNAGEKVLDAPAGIGTDEAPTTVGNFFVTFLQEPPDDGAAWGPFVMVISSHSETISDWEQSGDAIAAIHGPFDTGDAVGTTGAKVSHGCVRLHLEDLRALRDVPAGSPVDVIDSSTHAVVSP